MFEPQNTGETTPLPPVPSMPSQPTEALSLPQYPFRLLRDERVIATYPIANKKRAMGHLVSYLFVTDARVVYAAESKTTFSNSMELQEHRLDKIEGIETRRRRGFSALGAAITVGIVLNIIGLIILNVVLGSIFNSGYSSYSDSNPAAVTSSIIVGTLIALTILVGVVVVLNLLRPSTYLGIFGVGGSSSFAESRDWVTVVMTTFLVLILGPVAVALWLLSRGLGLFQASDAFLYADVENIDTIAYDAGAVIIDAQARGALAAG